MPSCQIIGAPVQSGASQDGCLMGPASFRTAGLVAALEGQGFDVHDFGDVRPDPTEQRTHPNTSLRNLTEIAGWIETLGRHAYDAATQSDVPVFLGGDHSLSAGTVPAVAKRAAEAGKSLFVLWLDAHPDIHTLDTTTSGNLHGTPVAYFTGMKGFDAYPPLMASVDPANVMMMGLRSVDPDEVRIIADSAIHAVDMRAIDEHGVAAPLRDFLRRVEAADGHLHVSLDVDFLDPTIAPAVGTTVPGGATFREAHLIMEILHDSGRVTSLDLVELNPFLDERGRTAQLMIDLVSSLFGRRILDRLTRKF
ncbi:MAG: arginase [Pseudomonadota bacterium]